MANTTETVEMVPEIIPYETLPGTLPNRTVLPRAGVNFRYSGSLTDVGSSDNVTILADAVFPTGYAYSISSCSVFISMATANVDDVRALGQLTLSNVNRDGTGLTGILTQPIDTSTTRVSGVLQYFTRWHVPDLPKGFLFNQQSQAPTARIRMYSQSAAAQTGIQMLAMIETQQYDISQVLTTQAQAALFVRDR
jgi:hypothetical protein